MALTEHDQESAEAASECTGGCAAGAVFLHRAACLLLEVGRGVERGAITYRKHPA